LKRVNPCTPLKGLICKLPATEMVQNTVISEIEIDHKEIGAKSTNDSQNNESQPQTSVSDPIVSKDPPRLASTMPRKPIRATSNVALKIQQFNSMVNVFCKYL
jgi:hypothetical protein